MKTIKSLSIIIPTYNDYIMTTSLLKELVYRKNSKILNETSCFRKYIYQKENSTARPEKYIYETVLTEIIVVDDGSNYIIKKKLKEYIYYLENEIIKKNQLKNVFLKILIVKNNTGFASSCNIGAKNATGEYILFLNNDMGYVSEAVLLGLEKLENNIGIMGCNLFYPDGMAQHLGVSFANDYYPCHFGQNAISLEEFDHFDKNIIHFQAISAAFLMINKIEFLELNGFKEEYRNGMEDIDFCLRYRKKYKKHIAIYSKMIAMHLESKSVGRKRHNRQNEKIFFERWKNEFGKYIKSDWLEKCNLFNLLEYHHRVKPPYIYYNGLKYRQCNWITRKFYKTLIKIYSKIGNDYNN